MPTFGEAMGNTWKAAKKQWWHIGKRAFQTKCKEMFPYLTRLYGYMDGPLDEHAVDEIIYIEGKDGSMDRVLCRNYGDDRRTFQEHLAAGTPLEDALEVEGGVFRHIGGDCIHSYDDLYDDDFEVYGSEEPFLKGRVLSELSRARKQFVEDHLRLNKLYAEHVGDYDGHRILVAKPNKMPVGQVLYFEGQSLAMSIFDKLWGAAKYIFEIGRIPDKDFEAYWVDFYEITTAQINAFLGLPKQIEAIRSLA